MNNTLGVVLESMLCCYLRVEMSVGYCISGYFSQYLQNNWGMLFFEGTTVRHFSTNNEPKMGLLFLVSRAKVVHCHRKV